MRQFALAILGVVVVGCSLNRSVTSASDTGPEGADADMDASDRGRDAAIDAGDAGGPSDVGVDVASGFMVYADRAADIPLRVGDAIDVMIDCTHGGWHFVCSGIVRDAAGALLFAVAGDGEPALVPGWTLVGDGPAPRGTGSVSQPILLEHEGQRVTTHPERWTPLRASDGQWLVIGSYTHFVGDGPRPPESSDYRSYAITRVRAAASRRRP